MPRLQARRAGRRRHTEPAGGLRYRRLAPGARARHADRSSRTDRRKPNRPAGRSRLTVRPRLGLSFSVPLDLAARGRLPEWPKGAVCKTVGSAYVGSNPTPATTCENAPLAANSRASGAFSLCPGMCHLVALWTVMLRCPRTYSGRPSARLGRSVWAAATVGVRSCDGRCAPSAVSRTATDGPHQRQVSAGPAPLGLAGASTITLVGHGCGDERRAHAVRGRSEGNSMGKSACLLDYAGAAEGLGAATGYRPSRRCLD